jgi:hypothetical protein
LTEIKEKLDRHAEQEGRSSWFYSEDFGEDRAAKAWGCPTDTWDSLPDEHKGRMWAVYRAELIMEAWESRQAMRRIK